MNRQVHLLPVESVREVGENIFILQMDRAEMVAQCQPGQFLNIRIQAGTEPLLRRPFSISRVDRNHLEVMFNAVGCGTRQLAQKKLGDLVDVLGPLGTPFEISGNYEIALLVAGGMGVAPFPILTQHLYLAGKEIRTFVGARAKGQLVTRNLESVQVATDDGSAGFKGTVVDLLKINIGNYKSERFMIFGCGPTPMLKALTAFVSQAGIPCQVSLECAMACGFGICQGCPVERSHGLDETEEPTTKYALVCKNGPVFNAADVIIS